MLLAVGDEPVETSACFVDVAEGELAHAGVEELVGGGVVVVEGGGWFQRGYSTVGPGFDGFVVLSECLVGFAEEVEEVVVEGSVELAFAEVVGVHQAFVEQFDGFGGVAAGEGFLGELYAAILILGGHFPFAPFPRVEYVVVEELDGAAVVAGEVEEGDLLEEQVVAALDELGIFLEESETLGMVAAKTLVELVEFHEYAGIGGVEVESAFHHLHGGLGVVELVESSEGEVAPSCGERWVELCRLGPQCYCEVILAFVVVEVAQVVGGVGIAGVETHGLVECEDGLEAVGEAEVGRHFGGFGQHGLGVGFLAEVDEAVCHVVACHGCHGILLDGDVPHVEGVVPATGVDVVEGHLVVVVGIAAHEGAHLVDFAGFVEAPEVERVDFEGVGAAFEGVVFAVHAVEYVGFKGACHVVVPVA